MTEPMPVHGVAIREGVSKNNIKYTAEELDKAAPSLSDVAIIKDHNATVDNTVGRTTKSDSDKGTTSYEGLIMDGEVQEKITDKRIKEVSVGGMGRLVKENDDDDDDAPLLATNISYAELSLTPTPGVDDVSILKTESLTERQKMLVTEALESFKNHNLTTKVVKENNAMEDQMDESKEKVSETRIKELEEKIKTQDEKLRKNLETKVIETRKKAGLKEKNLNGLSEAQLTALLETAEEVADEKEEEEKKAAEEEKDKEPEKEPAAEEDKGDEKPPESEGKTDEEGKEADGGTTESLVPDKMFVTERAADGTLNCWYEPKTSQLTKALTKGAK